MHALNTLFALLELLGTNAPPAPWAALPLTLISASSKLRVTWRETFSSTPTRPSTACTSRSISPSHERSTRAAVVRRRYR